MDPVYAFARAWRLYEDDAALWLKRQRALGPREVSLAQTLDFADLQANLADYVRDNADGDRMSIEYAVMRGLTRFRAGMAVDSLVQARQGWASAGAQAQVGVEDTRHEAVRQEAFDTLDATTYKWKARLDRRTCAYCIFMHGKVFPIGSPMLSHPNCRCMPVSPDRDLVLGEDWLNDRSEYTLRRILGPGRMKVLAANRDMKPSDFVDTSTRRLIPLRNYRRPARASRTTYDRIQEMDFSALPSLVRRNPLTVEMPDVILVPQAHTDLGNDDLDALQDHLRWLAKDAWEAIRAKLGDQPSNWSGIVSTQDYIDGLGGLKTADCSIHLFGEHAPYEGTPGYYAGVKTFFHELLHSFSPSAGRTYADSVDRTYMEEAPVEYLAREMFHDWLRADEARRAAFLGRPDTTLGINSYPGEVKAFEDIADLLNVDPEQLAIVLMRLPQGARVDYMDGLIRDLWPDRRHRDWAMSEVRRWGYSGAHHLDYAEWVVSQDEKVARVAAMLVNP